MRRPEGSLRRAAAADIAALRELWVEVTNHHAAIEPAFSLRPEAGPEIERLLAAQLRDPDTAIFVWDRRGVLLGFCSTRIAVAPPIHMETRRAEICDLGVRAAARREGVGSALVAAGLSWARGRGIDRVEVRVAVRNPEGQGFWRAQGFGDLMEVLQRRL